MNIISATSKRRPRSSRQTSPSTNSGACASEQRRGLGARLRQHAGRAVDAGDPVPALGERQRVISGAAAEIENALRAGRAVFREQALDEVDLAGIILRAIEDVVAVGVVRPEHRHASDSRTAAHTRSICASSSVSPEGR